MFYITTFVWKTKKRNSRIVVLADALVNDNKTSQQKHNICFIVIITYNRKYIQNLSFIQLDHGIYFSKSIQTGRIAVIYYYKFKNSKFLYNWNLVHISVKTEQTAHKTVLYYTLENIPFLKKP